ncbi:extensin-like [Tachyglossus aculeatus]|uniref:extensin-like n=1 Tax=Tachyglossus aculeatus TaxID=9261 RepID=UPI0018F7CD36|nr:extensin-like [Tachyglossus aculeatus]
MATDESCYSGEAARREGGSGNGCGRGGQDSRHHTQTGTHSPSNGSLFQFPKFPADVGATSVCRSRGRMNEEPARPLSPPIKAATPSPPLREREPGTGRRAPGTGRRAPADGHRPTGTGRRAAPTRPARRPRQASWPLVDPGGAPESPCLPPQSWGLPAGAVTQPRPPSGERREQGQEDPEPSAPAPAARRTLGRRLLYCPPRPAPPQ